MMNSSFLYIGQTCLSLLTLSLSGLLIRQFGFPRDTVRFLGFLFIFTLALMLVTDAAVWWGQYFVFIYPEIYAVYLGVMGLTWPAFILLGVLDHPSQLQKKIMWRLPILGGIAGHALGASFTVYLFGMGWLIALGIVLFFHQTQRYTLRILIQQIFISAFYFWFLTNGTFWAAQICFALWILFTHRIINAYMIKNKIREFNLPSPKVNV
ncbi:MAG: hypothetical protein K2P81_07495 [Bacteriovoracaceae bacterium]|nr:hypothetical protein [Bacteriovoracaceae bacterium]